MNPLVSLQAFWLGFEEPELDHVERGVIVFELAPHWHIYWENYGDSGMSTSVDNGTLLYPTPKKIPLSGELLSYGYEGRVVFFVPKAKSELTVRWLACKEDTCIPGKKRLSLQRGLVDSFQEEWRSLPQECSFDWLHRENSISEVHAFANSWMAPYSDISGSVLSQSKENQMHRIQWNTNHPQGRFLWVNGDMSCILRIKQ